MRNFIKVSGNDGLVRDMSTQAIINTNMDEYESYIQRRDSIIDQNKRIMQHETDINNIKADLQEIKELLLVAIKGIN